MKHGQVQFKTIAVGTKFYIVYGRQQKAYRKVAYNGQFNALPLARGDFPKYFWGNIWVYSGR